MFVGELCLSVDGVCRCMMFVGGLCLSVNVCRCMEADAQVANFSPLV